ncbi:hypothetical protein A2U01_0001602 [Trifolium medium]|uniref:Uncharacterized protein n=1 Tax=Trifolium medium TaxID=97028 RepID=A0A392M1G5_9FABA|nr:hypothetical protein [Trifolium medium]
MCGGSFSVLLLEVPAREFLSSSPSPRGNICPHPHPHRSPCIRGICRDRCIFPDPAPKCPQRNFYRHPCPHEEKISVFGAPNGAIPAGIRSNRCKLTSY